MLGLSTSASTKHRSCAWIQTAAHSRHLCLNRFFLRKGRDVHDHRVARIDHHRLGLGHRHLDSDLVRLAQRKEGRALGTLAFSENEITDIDAAAVDHPGERRS